MKLHFITLFLVFACLNSFAQAVTLTEKQAAKIQRSYRRAVAAEQASPLLAKYAEQIQAGNLEIDQNDVRALFEEVAQNLQKRLQNRK